MLANFFWLLFAHLLADYPLQGEFLANFKGKNPIILFTHAGIWTGCITLVLTLLGYHPGAGVVVSLFVVHAIVDVLKARNLLWYKHMDSLTWGLLIDQLIHVAQIIVALMMV
jgi:hypothetical protein